MKILIVIGQKVFFIKKCLLIKKRYFLAKKVYSFNKIPLCFKLLRELIVTAQLEQNPTKWTTKHIQTYVVVTAQLQLQFNLSWCDLNLTLHNNSAPAQPPFTQTQNMSVNGWSKVIRFKGFSPQPNQTKPSTKSN